ncbi:MAG TPA: exodeoxyribonuclease V subunit alpha [Fibrobacteria bacterium]|nr:exodeoxyribonuclease V subunit alpha [Fibrobacteria bacterium]
MARPPAGAADMNAAERFDSAWGRDPVGAGLRPLALRLWGSGRLGLLEIRQATLFGETPQARLLLLLLLASNRSGAPRATSSGLRQLLSKSREMPWMSSSNPTERDDDAEEAALPGHLALWDALVSLARRDPAEVAPWCKRPGEPGSLVEFDGVPDPEWAFQRSSHAETVLVDAVLSRLRLPFREVSPARAHGILGQILSKSPNLPHRLQARAVALSLRSPLLVVSGGPGTGKTAVVAQILRALRRLLGLAPSSVALAAPTGRAQARLSESLRQALSPLEGDLDPENVLDFALVESPAGTLHSLLGARGDGTFRHGPESPLPQRLVILDEASMVDLHLFSVLVSALTPDTTLVLLGDRDQLPSVDTGAVLSDLVGNRSGDFVSPETADWLEQAMAGIPVLEPMPPNPVSHPLSDRLVVLERSFRSVPEIAHAGRRVLASDASWSADLPRVRLSDLDPPAVSWLADDVEREMDSWTSPLVEGFHRWKALGFDVSGLRSLLERRRILCSLHGGPMGRLALNERVDSSLRRRLASNLGGHYSGRQVILGRNHPELDLRNGDLGVVAARDGRLHAAFAVGSGIRWVDIALISELEPGWALTVHKAQGSEFDEILFVLPEVDTPLLDRPIVYTAITRARRIVRLQGDPTLLDRALARVPDRPSRLRRVLGL